MKIRIASAGLRACRHCSIESRSATSPVRAQGGDQKQLAAHLTRSTIPVPVSPAALIHFTAYPKRRLLILPRWKLQWR